MKKTSHPMKTRQTAIHSMDTRQMSTRQKPCIHKDGAGARKYPPLQAETRETNQEDGKKEGWKKMGESL